MNLDRLSMHAAAMALILLLGACASPVLISHPVGAHAEPLPGLVYALPKAQVKVEAQRKAVDAEEVAKAKEAVGKTKTALQELKTAKKEADQQLKDAGDKLDNAPATAKSDLELKKALAQAWVNVLEKRVKAAQSKLNEEEAKVELLTSNVGKWLESAKLTILPPVPDVRARFVARIDGGAARDDNLKVAVSNGMLNSATSTSVDQTAEVLLNFARLGGAAKAATARFPTAETLRFSQVLPSEQRPESRCKAFQYVEVFDPTNPVEVQAAGDALYKLSGDAMAIVARVSSAPGPRVAPRMQVADGYVYRAPVPLELRVQPKDSTACGMTLNASDAYITGLVPDSSAMYVVPTMAKSLVTTKLTTNFKDGMLVDHQFDQPSQLVAVTSLPLNVLKAMLSVPAEIIKLRVDYQSESVSLVEARAKLLKAQLDLLNSQQALDDAKP